ncbi:isocitrate lyase/malate synthase [Penicillium malachiteum]|nr:isocitrate lyase/malate synthase [Penicillium malachiteum]
MSASNVPYPFQFDPPSPTGAQDGTTSNLEIKFQNVRGTSRPHEELAHACTYDGLSSRPVEEAGFPMVFLAGYAVSSSHGIPDTGYIAMAEMCDKIQESLRQVSVPIMADGDTGYGSPMNGKRTVESFAAAGAAGVMIEDQQWPKTMARAQEFKRIGVDAGFIEALPDREAMKRCVDEIDIPVFANIIERGKTENISAKELAELGYSAVAYPWTLVAAHLKSIREGLDGLKKSFTIGAPSTILTYDKERADKYKYN